MTTAIKMRLDNASNIYPASLTKKYATLFRMSVTLAEPVNVNYLQQALNATVKRIPHFTYTLSNGAFWWYLKENPKFPTVGGPSPLTQNGYKFHGGFLFKVGANGCKIVLDVFHALADGTGAQTFLLTLTAEYLRLRHGIEIDYSVNPNIFNPADAPRGRESEDCFVNFAGKKGGLEQNDEAYHLPGQRTSLRSLSNERFIVEVEDMKAVGKKYDATITEIFTAAMLVALQDVYKRDRRRHKKSAIKVNVPVNLRKLFPAWTLRNFSSYVNLGVDVANGFYTFEELLPIVKAQKAHYTLPSDIEKKIAANVALENSFAIAMIPLFIKRYVIDMVCKCKGDKLMTTTFSNMGNVVLPETMKPYVTEMDFILGRQRGTTGAAACVGYNGKLFLDFSRNIAESDFETAFADQLRELGVKVQQTSEELGY